MATPRKQYDWGRIEIEYRANKLSLRDIGKSFGVSESAIRKRAKKYGWPRDLANKVKARTEEKLMRSGIKSLDAKDEAIIEEIADRNTVVVQTHRKGIERARNLSDLMLDELTENTKRNEALEILIAQADIDEEWSATRRDVINRAVSLQTRVTVMRDLVTTMKTLQGLERTAYGIDGKESDEPTYEESLKALLEESD